MHIIQFAHHVKDVRGKLRRIHKNIDSTVLVSSFLSKAFDVLRHDARTLSRNDEIQIPIFDTIFDLSERHHNAKAQRLEISCALLCITQLSHFLG